jgi:hypothetical protein
MKTPEEAPPTLTREQIEELATLYDRFAHALDPFSKEREQAEEQFYKQLERLHSAIAPQTDFADFRREAVRACKMFLKRNR